MSTAQLYVVGLILSAFSSVAMAHHSRAEFVGDVIELEGELVDVEWVNPHPTLMLRTSGSAEIWEIQAYGSVGSLARAGIDSSLFTIGDTIAVAGLASSRTDNFFLGSHALLSNGTEAILQYNVGPHWTGEHVGGSGAEVIDESVLARAATDNRGLFRVWSVPTTETAIASFTSVLPGLTEAGQTGFQEAFDISAGSCDRPSMPWVMMTPTPREFVDNGNSIVLRVAYLAGASRTIHMEDVSQSDLAETSRLGVSFGSWEEDTLVIETSRIAHPSTESSNSEIKVTERFTLSDDQSRLDYELIMDDGSIFQGPTAFKLQYLALGEEFVPLCEPA